jgi:hypothetical protein
MSDQKSEHARRPGPLHISALVRRAASSTKSMLRGDPIKLKQGLDGIRDWTARLPALLDSPRWRAPLPNLTELSPGWRRHDRTHLEINLEYPAVGAGRTWEAWIFLPQSFRLNADTYSRQRIGADVQSHIRLSAPRLELGDVSCEVDAVVGIISQAGSDDAIDELKLFACRVREAIARDTLCVRMLGTDDIDDAMEAGAEALAELTASAMTSIRRTLIPAANLADPNVAETARWVDEHLSGVLETAMIKLVRDLSRRKSTAPALERARQTAVTEARHRVRLGAGPSVSADSSTFELEQVERHRHALKRLTSSVLWLESEAVDARSKPEHALHSIAAGIAMTFAVTAALLYGAPNDATDLWVWGGLVVLAYMGKDRIKATLQNRFNNFIDRRYPNRKWIVRHGASGAQIAAAEEKYRFVEPSDLPPEVARFRRDLQSDSLGETLELDSILHHRKAMTVDSGVVGTIDPRFDAITEILRIDVARWLTHTDDPSRTVTLTDPESGELIKAALPRAYDVTILHRLAPAGVNATWSAARVVLSRKGIRRVDQLDT